MIGRILHTHKQYVHIEIRSKIKEERDIVEEGPLQHEVGVVREQLDGAERAGEAEPLIAQQVLSVGTDGVPREHVAVEQVVGHASGSSNANVLQEPIMYLWNREHGL